MSSDTMAAVAFAGIRQCWPQTILLVEDEAFVRKVTAEVLESAGYRLVIAESAEEALAYRGRPAPDLLLADVVMPGMSGRELAAEFTCLYPSTRVLLMSGYAGELTDHVFSLVRAGVFGEAFFDPHSVEQGSRGVGQAGRFGRML